jgi:hypothetical protein
VVYRSLDNITTAVKEFQRGCKDGRRHFPTLVTVRYFDAMRTKGKDDSVSIGGSVKCEDFGSVVNGWLEVFTEPGQSEGPIWEVNLLSCAATSESLLRLVERIKGPVFVVALASAELMGPRGMYMLEPWGRREALGPTREEAVWNEDPLEYSNVAEWSHDLLMAEGRADSLEELSKRDDALRVQRCSFLQARLGLARAALSWAKTIYGAACGGRIQLRRQRRRRWTQLNGGRERSESRGDTWA